MLLTKDLYGKYVLFAWSTMGKFIEIDEPEALEYSWCMDDLEKYSPDIIVRWELEPMGKKTRIHLAHKGFDDKEMQDSHDEGWDIYWLEPIEKWLESKDEQ